MYKNCCLLRKNDKYIADKLDELGYFCSSPKVKKNISYTHGVYAYADDEDVVRYNQFMENNNLPNFILDCGTDVETFLRLAEEEI